MNDPEITQRPSGQASNGNDHPDQSPAAYPHQSLSTIISEENRFLYKKLAGSFNGYVVRSTMEGGESLTGQSVRKDPPSIKGLLSQSFVQMKSLLERR